jgi:adenine/guanine phosphoribosyltransferase-like PRPP-binding protein
VILRRTNGRDHTTPSTLGNGDLRRLREHRPARLQLTATWGALHPPLGQRDKQGLWFPILPFAQAFDRLHPRVRHDVWTKHPSSNAVFCSVKTDACVLEPLVADFIQRFTGVVGISDLLDLTLALDFNHAGGDPDNGATAIGTLFASAKPQDGSAPDTASALKMSKACASAIRKLKLYDSVDAVVGMPPSNPDNPFPLARFLAAGIAKSLGLNDMSVAVVKTKKTEDLQCVALSKKLSALQGSVRVEPGFDGKSVLLLDDIYQSGTTMNYVGLLLKAAGAREVLGLGCLKSCRNDDNVR